MIKEITRAILGNYYQKKGRIAIQEKRWEVALTNIDKALKFLPLDTGCLNNKGISLWKLGKYKEAIECFDLVIGRFKWFEDDYLHFEGDSEDYLRENFISALNNKGALLNQLGKTKEARKLHGIVLKLDQNRASAIRNLRLDIDSTEPNNKEDRYKSVERIHGEEIANKIILDEIETYNELLKKKPKDTSLLINKGVALTEINRFKDALDCYDKALRIEPSNIIGLLNKGSTLGRIGRYKEAIKCFDMVLKIEPNNKPAIKGKKFALNDADEK